jgi:hypothetical protein
MRHNRQFEYVGNLHIHSLYSDGAGSVEQIAEAARKANLDFIILNDHDQKTDGLHLDEEGFKQGVMVLLGLEIGGRYHHYLAYDLKKFIHSNTLSPQEIIDRVNDQSGFGFLAHPFEKGMPMAKRSLAYTWNDLSVKDYTGICIWNFSSRWKERVRTPLHGLILLLLKSQLLKGPDSRTIEFWDQKCLESKVTAIGGSDAHGSNFSLGPFRFTPLTYDYLLRTINVHILLDREMPKGFGAAKQEVYGALRQGRYFIAHEKIGNARGFRFDFISDSKYHLKMGQESLFQPGTVKIQAPRKCEIRLIKNGAFLKKWRGNKAFFRVKERGVYRVEIYVHLLFFGWRPWIFSNPIYLR